MNAALQKEFDSLQAQLDSLREAVEAREEVVKKEAKERLVRRVTELSAEGKSKQVWAIDKIVEPSWDPDTNEYVVHWEEIDRMTVRPYELRFKGYGDAIKHHQHLWKRRNQEERERRHDVG